MQAIRLYDKATNNRLAIEANLIEIIAFTDTAALSDETVSIFEYEKAHLTDVTIKFVVEGRNIIITLPLHAEKWGQNNWDKLDNQELISYGYDSKIQVNWFELFHNATRMANLPQTVSALFADLPKSTSDVVNNISGTLFEIVASMTKQMNEMNTSLIGAMEKVNDTVSKLNDKVGSIGNNVDRSMTKIFKGQLLMYKDRNAFLEFLRDYDLSETQFTPLSTGNYIRMGEDGLIGGNNIITNRNIPTPTGQSTFTIQSKAFFVDKGFSGNGWSTLLQEIYSSGAIDVSARKDTTHGLDAVGELAETNSNVALSGGSGPNEFTFTVNHNKLGLGVPNPEAFSPVYQEVYMVVANETVELITTLPPATDDNVPPQTGNGSTDSGSDNGSDNSTPSIPEEVKPIVEAILGEIKDTLPVLNGVSTPKQSTYFTDAEAQAYAVWAMDDSVTVGSDLLQEMRAGLYLTYTPEAGELGIQNTKIDFLVSGPSAAQCVAGGIYMLSFNGKPYIYRKDSFKSNRHIFNWTFGQEATVGMTIEHSLYKVDSGNGRYAYYRIPAQSVDGTYRYDEHENNTAVFITDVTVEEITESAFNAYMTNKPSSDMIQEVLLTDVAKLTGRSLSTPLLMLTTPNRYAEESPITKLIGGPVYYSGGMSMPFTHPLMIKQIFENSSLNSEEMEAYIASLLVSSAAISVNKTLMPIFNFAAIPNDESWGGLWQFQSLLGDTNNLDRRVGYYIPLIPNIEFSDEGHMKLIAYDMESAERVAKAADAIDSMSLWALLPGVMKGYQVG